ncbi:MAG: VirK family protein [Fimbriimonadaceae bacterium]
MNSLLAVLVALTIAPASHRLGSYSEIMSALQAGEDVRIVVDYSKTILEVDGEKEESPKAIGGTKIDSWEWFDKGVVRNELAYFATSHTVMIAHPRYGHVNNYVRFRVYSDGQVEITARYLSLDKNEILMDETFRGKVSDGKDQNGVSFFIPSKNLEK